MTIDEIIKSEQETADFHKRIAQMASSPKNKSEAQEYSDYHRQIINIMRKYQKIQEIVKVWEHDDIDYEGHYGDDYMEKISEVLEDGND